MKSSLKLHIVTLGLLIAAVAAPATAEEWKRPTAHGGEVSREVTQDGRVYAGETTRLGPNGGTYSSTSTCFDGFVDRCNRTFSATGPNGQSVTGQRLSARGPFRAGSVGSLTGPSGNTVVGWRRHWR